MKKAVSVALILVLLITLFFVTWSMISGFSDADPFGLLALLSSGCIGFLALVAIYGLDRQKAFTKIFKIALYFICILTMLGLLALATGYIQDLSGMHCSGFFGSTASCVSNQWLLVSLTLLNPFFYPFLGLLSIVALMVQFKRWRSRNSSKTQGKPERSFKS